SHVANTLRLLKLPHDVRDYVGDGRISAGHARSLVGMPDARHVAERIVSEGLSVRQIEELAADAQSPSEKSRGKTEKAQKDADTLALERSLSDALGYKVEINHKSKGGELKIHYRSLDQLDALCAALRAA
ncbi:MAG: chromosome partitioning protein ParB, partial [Pseudomonadota bacterium]